MWCIILVQWPFHIHVGFFFSSFSFLFFGKTFKKAYQFICVWQVGPRIWIWKFCWPNHLSRCQCRHGVLQGTFCQSPSVYWNEFPQDIDLKFLCISNLTVSTMARAGGNFWPSSSCHGGVFVNLTLRILLWENNKNISHGKILPD